jgi:methionine synthase II (cobalamin-independent)
MSSKIRDIKGLATGIGSLPHQDAGEALNLVFKYTPRIPFWPQLPKRDKREGMVAQFSEGLPCIEVSVQRGVFFNSGDKDKELAEFYEYIIKDDIEYFKISEGYASGLYAFKQRLKKSDLSKIQSIKCQVTGPFTFAASINDENNKALLHNSDFMQAIKEALVRKARWQIRFLEEFGKDIIMFIDEPYLGCFGSAYTPINREEVVGVLTELTNKIRSAGAVRIGVHCCGNTDWSIFTDIKVIDIISFDAFGFLDRVLLYARELRDFFNRGGILAWGIVPTQAFAPEIKSNLLLQKLEQGINLLSNKGIDKNLLQERLIFTPSCGLGTLSCQTADSIFQCLQNLSDNFKNKSI